MKNMSKKTAIIAFLLSTTVANADSLDVTVITVKKFTVLENGGVKIPPGRDSYWDFLEITNTDEFPAVITGVDGVPKGCIITDGTQFPLQLPPKSTLEFTIRQGCGGISGVMINLDGGLGLGLTGGPQLVHQQRYLLAGPLIRLATPVFQVRLQRSN